MKRALALTIAVLGLAAGVNAQEISPYLFGQNHWIAEGDEGNRVGYLHLLWPKVRESGITTVRIGGNGYNHHLPERQRLTAMIDEEPELAQAILDTATANIPLTMASFQPDGAWEAGPDYWAYTCRYAAFTIEALTTALGKDFDLSQAPGFSQTGLFPLYCTAPSGGSFNFADAKPESGSNPSLF